MDNLKFEIWKKNWKFGGERLEILIEKNWKSGEKLKLGKIVNLEKCGNLEKIGNLEKMKVQKNFVIFENF